MTERSVAGQALDEARLYTFLEANRQQLMATSTAHEFSVERFVGGYSNLTYAVRFDGLDLVLRRPPIGANVKSGHDMEREYKVLSGLIPIYPKVPSPIYYCDDVAVLGAPFYLMQRVEGAILRQDPTPNLEVTPHIMEQVSKAVVENLVAIHALDYTQTALKNLARSGSSSSYVERQVTGWLQRYAKAKTDDVLAMEQVGNWLTEHLVADSGSCMIHNDYKYDNIVLATNDLTQIKAVLDWEMATIGDPLMDLGTSLAYWIEPTDGEDFQGMERRATVWPGNFKREQVVNYYSLQSGREVGDIVFYFVFGLYKLAVISQQIYARYRLGLTQDARFEKLNVRVQVLAEAGLQAIERRRIDQLG